MLWWLEGTLDEVPQPGVVFLSACPTASVLQDLRVRHVSPQHEA